MTSGHSLGSYHSKFEAAEAYDAAAREHKGIEEKCTFPAALEL